MSTNSFRPVHLQLPGQRWLVSGSKTLFPAMGPAFLVSVGYMDPGNWATDLEGGSRFGYGLLWVLLTANLMALLLQYLSAKLGLATGRTYPQLCRDTLPRPVTLFLWITAEAAAVATDLAEFLGAALGFYLLFHIPLFWAVCITAFDVLLLLAIEATVVSAVPAVGVILSVALIVAPAATARLWTDRLATMTAVAVGVGAFSGAAGLMISEQARVSAGAAVVLVACACFGLSWLGAPRYGMVRRVLVRRRTVFA